MKKNPCTLFSGLYLLLYVTVFAGQDLSAQPVTFSYIFDGMTLAGTSTQAGATANNASYGAGVTSPGFFAGNPGDAIAGAGFAAGVPLNPANNDYFGFSITAGSCFNITLSGVSFDARRSATGPQNLELRSSADGFATALYNGTLTGTNFEAQSGILPNLTIVAGQTLQFRIYGFNASAAAGTLRLDNVTFNGALSCETVPPVLVGIPANVTVQCNAVPFPANPTATDNCTANVTVDFVGQTVVSDPACPQNSGVLTRVWIATDDCGNTATASQQLTIVDTQAPVLMGVPANVTVQCNAVPFPANVTATDNCDPTVSVEYLGQTVVSDPGCPQNSGVLTRVWMATDDCGNTATASQQLTIVDTQAPILMGVPANVTVQCNAVPPMATVTATDNCAVGVTVFPSSSITPGTCPDRYTIIRTWTATDNCGNTTTASQAVQVVDTQAPVLAGLPANVTVQCNAVPPPANVTATDNCDASVSIAMTATTTPGSCANNYVLRRTWTATDNCGNTATGTQLLNVIDTQAPVFGNVPANITVECDQLPSLATPTATDGCPGTVNVTFTETTAAVVNNCPIISLITRRWLATDACGNTAQVIQTIHVQDTRAPEFNVLAQNIALECDIATNQQDYQAWIDNHGNAVVYDCSAISWSDVETPDIIIDPTECGASFFVFRRFIATDQCGNSSFSDAYFRTDDLTPPAFLNAPADTTIECLDLPDQDVLLTADNCGEVSQEYWTYVSDYLPGIVRIVRLWRATDECGNSATHSQILTLNDPLPPVLVGSTPNITITQGDPLPPLPAVYVEDACGFDQPLSLNFGVSYGTDGNGDSLIIRTWVGCDLAGNCSSLQQIITVILTVNKPPYFITLAYIPPVLPCEEWPLDMLSGVVAYDFETDTFVPVTGTEVLTPTECGDGFIGKWTWTAIDPLGATATQTITATILLTGKCFGDYCPITVQDSNTVWISTVGLGENQHVSAAEGYGNFTDPPLEVVKGGNYPLNLTATTATPMPSQKWAAWADWNHDEDFDDAGEFYDLGVSATPFNGNLHIPMDALPGFTRLRIGVTPGADLGACSAMVSGEIEDYTLLVKGLGCPIRPCAVAPVNPNNNYDYIKQVVLNNLNNVSGKEEYSDFTHLTANLNRSQNYEIQLSSATVDGYIGQKHWLVLSDWNRDGDYEDANEKATASTALSNLSMPLNVPASAFPGRSVLRVVVSRQPLNDYCFGPLSGETEDYSLYIAPTAADSVNLNGGNDVSFGQTDPPYLVITGHEQLNLKLDASLQPNPSSGMAVLNVDLPAAAEWTARVMDGNGRLVSNYRMAGEKGLNSIVLDLAGVKDGVYVVFVQAAGQQETLKLVILH